jgi:hypothetical protein
VKIGIIAEDNSDVMVLQAMTLTMLKPRNIGFSSFVGDGCGKLRRKCAAWAQNLVNCGCHWIVLVHDRDNRDIQETEQLRRDLTEAVNTGRAKINLILIPKKEIEAWLLYDADAIATVFGRNHQLPRLPGDPELLQDPKSYLQGLVRKKYRKSYLTTLHNPAIAKHIRTERLRRSPSFRPHFAFVAQVRATLR